MFSLWLWAFGKAESKGVIKPALALPHWPKLANRLYFMAPDPQLKPFQCHLFAIIKNLTASLSQRLLTGGGVDALRTRRHDDGPPVERARADADESKPPMSTTTHDQPTVVSVNVNAGSSQGTPTTTHNVTIPTQDATTTVQVTLTTAPDATSGDNNNPRTISRDGFSQLPDIHRLTQEDISYIVRNLH